MQKDLSDYRKSYGNGELLLSNVEDTPFKQFKKWFEETEKSAAVEEVNAMTLATFGTDGFPKSRVVLLKEFSDDGFVFYTNYKSEKGKAILANPKVCLSFFWPKSERQVIIKGIAEKISEKESEAYFQSRPHGSKLGALVSDQSSVIADRDVLEKELEQLEEKYLNREVPKPKEWGGYLVKPVSFEFWQGRPNRLHDRIRFSLKENMVWKTERLAP